ncbi:MAG: matrixin family metalloprotease [Armatimonadetes bacterium]|nr:matrixin family metalloprotease [Armatimonadota bacterium]
MVAVGVASVILFAGVWSEPPPRLVDRPLADYYARALAAESEGEPHKALAMLNLLLIPEETYVAVDYSALPENERARFRRGVALAFEMWGEALGDDFPFRLVAEDPDAQVQLRFLDDIKNGSADCKGEIRSKRRIQWNHEVHYSEFTAEIDVSKFGRGGKFLGEGDVTHIVAHELGHALGLGDASARDRIMGAVAIGNPYGKLHASEVEAVKAFRQLIRAQINRISSDIRLAEPSGLVPDTAG